MIEYFREKLTGKKYVHILMTGLQSAGKTTILYKLKMGEATQSTTTIGFNVETFDYSGINLTIYDIGQDKIKVSYNHYNKNIDGLIFVVDSNDEDRIKVSGEELKIILNKEELKDCPILIFANKKDLKTALSKEEVIELMGINNLNRKNLFVQDTCAVTGDGLKEGFNEFASFFEKK